MIRADKSDALGRTCGRRKRDQRVRRRGVEEDMFTAAEQVKSKVFTSKKKLGWPPRSGPAGQIAIRLLRPLHGIDRLYGRFGGCRNTLGRGPRGARQRQFCGTPLLLNPLINASRKTSASSSGVSTPSGSNQRYV
jgi:hypothetical protein